MSADSVPFLWVYGADGVGKSAVAWEIYLQVTGLEMPAAYVDYDAIGHVRPDRDDDPYNHRLRAANLGAMWLNFRAAGARCLVTSGVVRSREVAHLYRDAVPDADFKLCRLRASAAELRSRILYRGQLLGVGTKSAVSGMTDGALAERVASATRYAEELDRDDIADFCVDTDGIDVPEVARRLRAKTGGWPQIE